MRKRRTVTYTNSLGQSIKFANKKPFFVESFDCTSVQGVYSTDTLAQSVGQITTSKSIGARTVVCDFALCLPYERHRTDVLNEIIALFNPLSDGVLTVETDVDVYEIDCYPSAVPCIKKDSNVPYVYRFSVDFVCDYPYFRAQGEIVKPLKNPASDGSFYIKSSSVVDTPFKIYIPAGERKTISFRNQTILNVVNGVFTNQIDIKSTEATGYDGALTIDTKEFTVTDEDGNDCSNYISGIGEVGDVYLTYGDNRIRCSPYTVGDDVVKIGYYKYVLGVV